MGQCIRHGFFDDNPHYTATQCPACSVEVVFTGRTSVHPIAESCPSCAEKDAELSVIRIERDMLRRKEDTCSSEVAKTWADNRRLLSVIAEKDARNKELEAEQKSMTSACPTCGPSAKVDEDGLCISCGATVAVGYFVEDMWNEMSPRIVALERIKAAAEEGRAALYGCREIVGHVGNVDHAIQLLDAALRREG